MTNYDCIQMQLDHLTEMLFLPWLSGTQFIFTIAGFHIKVTRACASATLPLENVTCFNSSNRPINISLGLINNFGKFIATHNETGCFRIQFHDRELMQRIMQKLGYPMGEVSINTPQECNFAVNSGWHS